MLASRFRLLPLLMLASATMAFASVCASGAWICSYAHAGRLQFTFRGTSFNWQNRSGQLTVMLFHTEAEDDFLWQRSLAWWQLTAVCASLCIGFGLIRRQLKRRRDRRGFQMVVAEAKEAE